MLLQEPLGITHNYHVSCFFLHFFFFLNHLLSTETDQNISAAFRHLSFFRLLPALFAFSCHCSLSFAASLYLSSGSVYAWESVLMEENGFD